MDMSTSFMIYQTGRDGTIVKEAGKTIEVYWETSGLSQYDIVFGYLDLREWKDPKGERISREKQIEILHLLRAWLHEQELKSNINQPYTVETTRNPCAGAGCSCREKVKGSAYCPRHYDENLLMPES